MKKTISAIFVLAMAVSAPAATKKAPAAARPQALTIPKDAVPNPDGTYSYTDKQGRKWIYNKTPFGLMKIAVTNASSSTPMDGTKVIDKGDVVGFEHATPFGMMRWEKKRSELTADERTLVESQNAKPE